MAIEEQQASPAPDASRPVRVAVVDDSEDIRFLLRLSFGNDPRFEVVGEAADGTEAVELARHRQPDLMVLDRQMPVMGGVEALPLVREASPRTAVVLYTAGADSGTYQAALSAGALDVVEKAATTTSVVDTLAEILLSHWAAENATVEVRVGPIDSEAARIWLANTITIIGAMQRHPDTLPVHVPPDVLELFDRFLHTWEEVARQAVVFTWAARTTTEDIQRLVTYWAALDRISDDDLARLGCTWSPPQGQPFFVALTTGVLEALDAHAESRQLARTLATQWPGAGRGPVDQQAS